MKLFTQSEVTVVGTIENINMIYSWFMVSRYSPGWEIDMNNFKNKIWYGIIK